MPLTDELKDSMPSSTGVKVSDLRIRLFSLRVAKDNNKDDPFAIYLERRDFNDDIWAIVDGSSVYTKDGQWEYEPLPSSRTEEFIANTRWSFLDAVAKCVEAYKKRPWVNIIQAQQEKTDGDNERVSGPEKGSEHNGT